MELRFGSYAIINNSILKMYHSEKGWELMSKDLGFIKYGFIKRNRYCFKMVEECSNISAFYVNILGSYKTYECAFAKHKIINNIVYLLPSSEYLDYLAEIGKCSLNYYHCPQDPEYQLKVNESEVLNIWERREPIKGFKFDVEPRFYLKKDGIWLENYEEE